MSVFTPHIAISIEYPRLELPMGFRPDDIDILVRATQEERAVVVNTGSVALRGLLEKRNEISKGDAYNEGKQNGIAAENVKWQQEKKQIVNDYKTKEKELGDRVQFLQGEMNSLNAAKVAAETRCAEAVATANEIRALEQEKINRTRDQVESEMANKLKNLTEELNTKKAEADKAASDLWGAQQSFLQEMEKKSSTSRDEEKKLRGQLNEELKKKRAEYDEQLKEIKLAKENEIERQKEMIESMSSKLESANAKLTEELKNAQAASEKASEELLRANQKAAEDVNQAKDTLNSKIEQLQRELNILTGRQANSSIKGKDNEDAFDELLSKSFGSDKDYEKLPKTNESGDHVIKWKGIKLMFENKKYKTIVPKTQVDKALRDFMSNKDCDVLIFVSEDTNIINRNCPFDISRSDDGRPAIWISNFSHNEDKVIYLQLVGQVAEELVRLQRREKKFENGEEIVDYKKRVEDLIQSFNETKDDLDKLLKLQNACQRRQNKIWKDLKEETVSVIARFKCRQAEANGNKEEGADGENGAEADSEPKVKKPRKTPMKSRTPQQSKNTMFNYLNKSPQVLASGHQPQQEGSNGFNAEVGENKAKLQLFQTNQ